LDITIFMIATGAAIAVAVILYMIFIEQFNIQVRELELKFPNLPPAFDGFTILHLSDLHLSKLGTLEKRLMRLIESREVDICIITGDVTAIPRASDIFRRVCSAIKRNGLIYLILGNSEHKPWLDTSMLVKALSFDGLEMLINSSTVIRRGDESISIVGIDDPYSRLADLDAAFNGVDPDNFIIYLTHCPSTTPEGIRHGADLILAGHTHGGQVRIPLIGMIYTHMRSNRALNDGLFTPDRLHQTLGIDPGNSILFINRGVGTSRLHIRFRCPPEIAYITLKKG